MINFAQAPLQFHYQVLVRNDSGLLVRNTPVGVRSSILSSTYDVLYREFRVDTTDAGGVLTLDVGTGEPEVGVFGDIDWSVTSFFLQTEIDPAGGHNFIITLTQRLMSVPYARYSNDAGNDFSGDYNDLYNKPYIFSGDYYDLVGRPDLAPVATSGDYNDLYGLPGLAPVATSGNYNDLVNKPNLAPVATSGNYSDLNGLPNLAPVATSGNYNDLVNKPTIPTVPANVSAFANDAGYLTQAQLGNILNLLNQQLDSIAMYAQQGANCCAIPDGDGLPCQGTPTVTDYDGNTYNTVKIGNQCWMKENLRVAHYADGTEIVMGSGNSNTIPYRYFPNNNSNNLGIYGYLYNWAAIMYGALSSASNPSGVQGVCPTGWHIPSDAEWTQLTDYVGQYPAYRCDGNSSNIAKALAAPSNWSTHNGECSVGNDPSQNNTTGFNAMPAGYYEGGFHGFGSFANIWSSTENNTSSWYRYIDYNRSDVTRYSMSKARGKSLRCVLGTGYNLPSVTTAEVTGISMATAMGGGEVTYGGNTDVTARGLCWSTSPNPTLADAHTTNGSGLGAFTGALTGLSQGVTYHVRAYATNSMGTRYGNEVTFTTGALLPPTVVTGSVAGITFTTAVASGQVSADGGAAVTARGVCWGTSPNPTVSGAHTTDGSGLGSFTSTLVGLSQGITYHVRAYATNSVGTAYGEDVVFTTQAQLPPIVVTNAPLQTGNTAATGGGEVTGDGGATVTTRGLCWSTNHNPTVADAHTTDGSGTGAFTSLLTGLAPLTTYYVRAYATNSAGTAYGEEQPLVMYLVVPKSGNESYTLTGSSVTVYDHGGPDHNYEDNCNGSLTVSCPPGKVFQIGGNVNTESCCDHLYLYDGTGTVNLIAELAGSNTISAPYYTSQNNLTLRFSSNESVIQSGFALLLNTVDAVIPGTVTIGGDAFACDGGSVTLTASSDVAGTYTWSHGATGASVTVGAGTYTVTVTTSSHHTMVSQPFTVTAANSVATNFTVSACDSYTWNGHTYTQSGDYTQQFLTVCGCDSVVTLHLTVNPSVTTEDWLTLNELQLPYTYRDTVFQYGVPASSDIVFHRSTVHGCDSTHVLHLTVNYIPAGDAQPCPGTPTVTDYDGNTYNTVKIGNQCWMKENLRATHYADGTEIPNGSSNMSYTAPYYYVNPSVNAALYGYYYNWPAAMHGSSSSSANPSGVQGVCPTGWHLPSDAEWTQLTDYVSSVPAYLCGGNSSNIAKALAATEGWNSWGGECKPGDQSVTANNATGFSAVPAGDYYGSSFYSAGVIANFWSSSQYENSDYAYYRYLGYGNNGVARSYHSKDNGFSVRCVLGDGQSLPAVTTAEVSNVTLATATGGGTVTYDGNANVTARGVCWNTTGSPTLADAHTTDGTGTGAFTSSITGLQQGTTYYVRAYATNSMGTAYGNEVTFTTLAIPAGDAQPCPGTPTVTDYDGNTYNTVKIGNQCWMKENLRTTHYADGTEIALGNATSYDVAYRYYPNNNSNNVGSYGYLYNWAAVMHGAASSSAVPSGVQGVCPDGWHVPSDAEWTQLTDYVGSVPAYWCGGNSSNIAKALASPMGWIGSFNDCSVGNNIGDDNVTGFSGVPAGYFGNGTVNGFGSDASLWSCTETSAYYAYGRYLYPDHAQVGQFNHFKNYGRSVRCVFGDGANLPGVTTAEVSNVSLTTATGGGEVTYAGNTDVTARGVCWNTTGSPTLADAHTNDGSGTGVFTSAMSGLAQGTTYHVRAYATNSMGTAYGNEVTFTTLAIPAGDAQPCPGTPTVTDYDGNTYNTVKIGNQCWMKENLRTTHYADGTEIALGNANSYDVAYRYYPNGNSDNLDNYGYLYNWAAVMHGALSSTSIPSGVQGICPDGWHVPSDAEWTQLTDYVGSVPANWCDGNSGDIAKALAVQAGWTYSSSHCVVGGNDGTYNATGFSAMPAGRFDVWLSDFGNMADFWSTTTDGPNGAMARYLYYNNAHVGAGTYNRDQGKSVRCVLGDGQSLPGVTTAEMSGITLGTAISGGNVTYDGNATVTARGVCWNTTGSPTLADAHTTVGSGTGAFTSSITGLQQGTTYYVRAYATNSMGTAYGNEVTFTTLAVPAGDAQPCPGTPTVTDYDGNVYNTVKIGDQCWMKENLRTTHYADGEAIAAGSSTSYEVGYRYDPDNNATNVAAYGYLYNWTAVMRGANSSSSNPSNVQGICPAGWHVPSDAEWTQLTDYVSSVPAYWCDGDNNKIAKALSTNSVWSHSSTNCAIGNNLTTNNTTGFCAMPAGSYYGGYQNFNCHANYWSTTEKSIHSAKTCEFYCFHFNAYPYYGNTSLGNSVRCVLGDGANLPGVTTAEVSNVSLTTATGGGDVTYDGNATVTARGVCWNTTGSPTLADAHTTDGSGTGVFTSALTGLAQGTTYHVRAYATNSMGTAYGNEVTFTTGSLCDQFAVRILGDSTVPYGDTATLHAMVPGSVPPVAVGDILCTDGATVKPADYAASGKTALGVVFHVDGTGLHGWAVNLHDQSTSIAWGGYGTDIPTLPNYGSVREALADTAGYANTAAIRAYGDASTYPAAWAVDLDNGWYLPAAGQLRALYGELPTLNTSLQTAGGTQFPMSGYWYYWSSTEYNSSYSWYLYSNGILTNYNKNDYHRVRSVRAF